MTEVVFAAVLQNEVLILIQAHNLNSRSGDNVLARHRIKWSALSIV